MFKNNFRWVTIIWIVLIGTIAYADRVNFSMVAPIIAKEYSLNSTQLGLIMSGFTIGYMIASFPGGLLSKWFSSRTIIIVAMLGWSVMTFLTSFNLTFVMLLLVRICLGCFEGPFYPNSNKIIGAWSLPKDRGLAAGMGSIGTPVGIIFGTILSSALIVHWDWRSCFWTLAIIGFVVSLLSRFFLWDKPKDSPFVSEEEKALIESSQAEVEILQKQTDGNGLSLRQLFKDPIVWALWLSWFTISLGFWGNINWLPTYFIKARGTDVLQAGINTSVPYFGYILGVIIIGYLADKISYFKTYKSRLLMVVSFLNVIFVILGTITPSIGFCLFFFTMATFLMAGAFGVMMTLEIELWRYQDVATVHGFILMGGGLAGSIAPILVGRVLDLTNSFNIAFYFFAVCAVISGICSWYITYKRKKLTKIEQL